MTYAGIQTATAAAGAYVYTPRTKVEDAESKLWKNKPVYFKWTQAGGLFTLLFGLQNVNEAGQYFTLL